MNCNGVKLPLQAGFKLSLGTLVASWACPACHSAHGSGVYPSREVSAKILASNRFYYRPADKALFVISDTCFAQYVKGIGAYTDKRFIVPTPVTVPAQGGAVKGK